MSESVHGTMGTNRPLQVLGATKTSAKAENPGDTFKEVLNGFYVKKEARANEEAGGRMTSLNPESLMLMSGKNSASRMDMSERLMSNQKSKDYNERSDRSDLRSDRLERQSTKQLKKVKERLTALNNRLESAIERSKSNPSNGKELTVGDANQIKGIVKKLEKAISKYEEGAEVVNGDVSLAKKAEEILNSVKEGTKVENTGSESEAAISGKIDIENLLGLIQEVQTKLSSMENVNLSGGESIKGITAEFQELKGILTGIKNGEAAIDNQAQGDVKILEGDLQTTEEPQDPLQVATKQNPTGTGEESLKTANNGLTPSVNPNQSTVQDGAKANVEGQAAVNVQGAVQQQTGTQGQGTNNQSTPGKEGDISVKATTSGKASESNTDNNFGAKLEILKNDNTLTKAGRGEMNPNMRRLEAGVIEQLENMMKSNLKIMKSNASEIVMKLRPDNLGNVSIKMMMESGSLSATLSVENPVVKVIVENNLNELRTALADKGYNVSSFNIDLSNNGTGQERQAGEKSNFNGIKENGEKTGDVEVEGMAEGTIKRNGSESMTIDSLV